MVVTAGDSLWSIAARHLPPGATDAQVAAAWPGWYQTNSAVIGADPDLIRPGPAHGARDRRGAGTVSADVGAVVLTRGRTPAEDAFARVRGSERPQRPPGPRAPGQSARDVPRSGSSPPSRRRSSRRRPVLRTPCPRPQPVGSRSCASATGRSSWRPTTTPLACFPTATPRRSPARSRWPRWRCWPGDARWRSCPPGRRPGVYETLQVRAGLTQRVRFGTHRRGPAARDPPQSRLPRRRARAGGEPQPR